LDPACGTAGFLISAYSHILKNNKDKDGNSTLSADERKRLTENFAGYDISPDMVRLSRVNMYLHKFTKPQISEYDTLTSLEKWGESFDVILANPPFMTPKGGIIPHNRYRVKAKRAEVLFVDYIAEHLNPTGKAGVIVPEGIVFQSANAYKALRKYLVEDDLLYAVISLPAGVFNPYSGVKTSILLMDRTLAKQNDEILFVKINNDGYDLGAQRREIKGSDIPEAIRIVKDYMNGEDVSDNSLVTVASKKDIAEQDYILVGERYKEAIIVNSDYPLVELEKISLEIRNGTNVTQIDEPGKYRVTRIQTIANGTVDLNKTKWTNDEPAENYFMESGDILLSHINSYEHLAKTAIFPETNEKVVHGINLIRFRLNKSIINPNYAIQCMKSDLFINRAKTFAQKAVNQASIKTSDLKQIRVPLPPLHIQEEIVKEIEGYQNIIDGARQVVENYKPTIIIDPGWEMLKLGDVCDVRDGTHDSPKYVHSGYPLITSKNVKEGKIDFDNVNYITQADFNTINLRSKVDNGDIIMPMIGTIGRPIIVNTEIKFAIKNVALIKFKNDCVINKYVYLILTSKLFDDYIENTKRGGTQKFISLKDIRSFSIPIPSIDVQQEIVNEISEEIEIIEQNKRLIELFEQKIKRKISEVWGE
jgi:type I restriction enzyme M protein